MKICKFCNKEKDISSFSIKDSIKGRVSTKCKQCHNDYVRNVWYPLNTEKQLASNKKWKNNNPEKVLLGRYDFLSNDEIQLHNLKDRCEICGTKEGLVLDHCHNSNSYRGKLCGKCNRGIGLFSDNIELLKNAISYLSNYKESKIKRAD